MLCDIVPVWQQHQMYYTIPSGASLHSICKLLMLSLICAANEGGLVPVPPDYRTCFNSSATKIVEGCVAHYMYALKINL